MNSVTVYQPLTTGISDRNSQAQFNNAYANAIASGDPRSAAKQYDRPGLSRGAGQMSQAGVDAASSMADGIAEAYQQKANNDAFNANTALQAQQMSELNAQQLAGFQSQEAYANAMAALQRQQAAMNFFGGLTGLMNPGGFMTPPSMPQAPSYSTPPLVSGILGRLLG